MQTWKEECQIVHRKFADGDGSVKEKLENEEGSSPTRLLVKSLVRRPDVDMSSISIWEFCDHSSGSVQCANKLGYPPENHMIHKMFENILTMLAKYLAIPLCHLPLRSNIAGRPTAQIISISPSRSSQICSPNIQLSPVSAILIAA